MARPTDCTPETIRVFCDKIRKGLYLEDAAVLAGISHTSVQNWTRRGEEGEEPYASFVAAYKVAEAEAQEMLIDEIRGAKGGKDSPPWQSRAWVMERRWYKKYGRAIQEIEHSGTVQTVKVELPAGATIDQLRAMAGKQGE